MLRLASLFLVSVAIFVAFINGQKDEKLSEEEVDKVVKDLSVDNTDENLNQL